MVLLYRINKYYKWYSVTSDDRYAYTQLSLSALNDRDTMMSLYEDIHDSLDGYDPRYAGYVFVCKMYALIATYIDTMDADTDSMPEF